AAAATATASATGLRRRQILAGQFLGAGGSVIDEGRFDDRHLLHVGLLDAVVNIHVGVMGASVVVHRVLDELEAGETHAVEGLVVGAAGVPDGDDAGGEVLEGGKPLLEDRPHHLVAL